MPLLITKHITLVVFCKKANIILASISCKKENIGYKEVSQNHVPLIGFFHVVEIGNFPSKTNTSICNTSHLVYETKRELILSLDKNLCALRHLHSYMLNSSGVCQFWKKR